MSDEHRSSCCISSKNQKIIQFTRSEKKKLINKINSIFRCAAAPPERQSSPTDIVGQYTNWVSPTPSLDTVLPPESVVGDLLIISPSSGKA